MVADAGLRAELVELSCCLENEAAMRLRYVDEKMSSSNMLLNSHIEKAIERSIYWNRILRFLLLFKSGPMLRLLSTGTRV